MISNFYINRSWKTSVIVFGGILILAFCSCLSARAQTDPNYIRTRSLSRPGVTDATTAAGLTDAYDVRQSTEYFDGLGRPIQTVSQKGSPAQNDQVSLMLYDPVGRQAQTYMPYTSPSADGNYKSNAFSEQNIFNSTQFPGETYYYSQTVFEASPLNRPLFTYPQGFSWVGSSRGVGYQYLLNDATDSVHMWYIALAAGSLPIDSGYYPASQLQKNVTTDEQGHEVIEYKNKTNQTILKKVQMADVPGTAYVGWLCTYYIYDDLNNLRFVMQPRAVEILNAGTIWTLSWSVADELCFRYEYDLRNRMILKKVPGAGVVNMVYDVRDRLVMSQDSLLRAQQKWQYMGYDDLNRINTSGLLSDPANYNHPAYHQGLAATSTAYPNLSSYSYEQLQQTLYDTYLPLPGFPASMATGIASNSSYFITTYNTAPLYAVPITAYPITRGQITGRVAKIVGTASQYVYDQTFYDDHGRPIQVFSANYTGGVDTLTTQYDFSGKPLRRLFGHAKLNNTVQSHRVLTKTSYDAGSRVMSVRNNIDGVREQLIDTMQYNELGQLRAKHLGDNLDSLIYDYNLRGWTTGINKSYVDGLARHYFGMQIGYNYGVEGPGPTQVAQFTGNIDGVVWKSGGDGIRRKFDFKYDNSNRITRAEYQKNTSGDSWDANSENYSMWGFDQDNGYGIKYDANGNILTMILGGQKGLGSPQVINALHYAYMSNSNKLQQVWDDSNDPNTTLGNFHYNSSTKTSTDYGYDGNGNLSLDKNKNIDKINYNFLNLPQLVHMNGKGNILYTYDAAGNKMQKQVIDSVSGLATTTLYLGEFEYQRRAPIASPGSGVDTLQFMAHEEGRARWAFHRYTTGDSAYAWEYDFTEKDYLGNTRVLLTEQKDTANYMCTMEPQFRTTEDALFSNVDVTSYTLPGWVPQPPHGPASNTTAALTDGYSTIVGPAKLLKVMTGDTVTIGVDAWLTNTTPGPQTSSSSYVLNGVANGLVSMTGSTHGSFSDLTNASSPIALAVSSFILANEPTPATTPKAYLNWMLLDNHLNYVSAGSGAIPATTTNAWSTLASTVPINTSGYLYIWVSNETYWVMWWDNLSIQHRQGPMLEENHYYPFGLTIADLSDKALKPQYAENKFRYNGKELQNQEFSDGSGLEEYDYGKRFYDQQIGRWNAIDPKADSMRRFSPYNYGFDNPMRFVDPDGMRPLDNYYYDRDGNLLAVQRTKTSVDNFYQISADGKQITFTRQLGKGTKENPNSYERETDNDKVNNVAFKDRNPGSNADAGSGLQPTSPSNVIAAQESESKSSGRILGGVRTSFGKEMPLAVSNRVNPEGANPAVVLPANSNIPAPTVVGTTVDLPAGSLPANVRPTGNGPDAGKTNVTDANGNYIPQWQRKN